MKQKNKDIVNKLIFDIVCCPVNMRTIADIKPESNITTDLGADSLDEVEIIMAIEIEFDMSILDDDDARTIKTVQDAYDFIDNWD